MYIWILPEWWTLNKLNVVKIKQKPIAISLICKIVIDGKIMLAKAPIPNSAKALLKLKANHADIPANVPNAFPKLLPTK